MDKKSGLKRLRFKLHAKGRHGTHSPFVYHFIERVLRNKQHYLHYPTNVYSRKQWDLLNATICYLNPKFVWLPTDRYFKDFNNLWPNRTFRKFTGTASVSEVEDTLVMLPADRVLTEWTSLQQKFGNGVRLGLYIIHPHHPEVSAELHSFFDRQGFQLYLDFWDAALWMQSTDFKERQYFNLRSRF